MRRQTLTLTAPTHPPSLTIHARGKGLSTVCGLDARLWPDIALQAVDRFTANPNACRKCREALAEC